MVHSFLFTPALSVWHLKFSDCMIDTEAFCDWYRYILMAEPDHIFANPLPNLAHGDNPAGFPFFYIKPTEHEKIVRKFYPEEKGPVTDVDPIGNSPVIIKKVLLLFHL